MIPLVNCGVRRWLAGLLLIAVLPVSFLREPKPPRDDTQAIAIIPLPLPTPAQTKPHLGAFRLEGVWRMTSRNAMFDSYSTLQRLNDGQFLSISDRGYALRFSPPGEPAGPVRMTDLVDDSQHQKSARDAESSAYDPNTGRIWIGWEGRNAISRLAPDLRQEARVRPAAMRHWDKNGGPEAMVRLADGRFLVLAEGFTGWFEDREHEAVLFRGDPTRPRQPLRFRLSSAAEFSPTDMAQLPDGRVLILMRRLVWPFPYRFVGRIELADPKAIRAGQVWRSRTVAYLSSTLPVDNFEGIVAEPKADGRVAVWIISDDNTAVTQRTLLWKMTVDPAQLR
jgi:hypothetical protein